MKLIVGNFYFSRWNQVREDKIYNAESRQQESGAVHWLLLSQERQSPPKERKKGQKRRTFIRVTGLTIQLRRLIHIILTPYQNSLSTHLCILTARPSSNAW
jgi:hypothetical protein